MRANRGRLFGQINSYEAPITRRLTYHSLATNRPKSGARSIWTRDEGFVGIGSVTLLNAQRPSCQLTDRRHRCLSRRRGPKSDPMVQLLRIVERWPVVSSIQRTVGLSLTVLAARNQVLDDFAVERILTSSDASAFARA